MTGSSAYGELLSAALTVAGRKAGNTAIPDALKKFLRLKADIEVDFWTTNVRRKQ